MATTIPACKAAVLTILAARSGLAGVTLSWAGPTKDEDFQPEMIYLGATDDESEWVVYGGTRKESYQLDVTVWVEQFGDDPQAVELRAHALWDEVEDGLRDDVVSAGSALKAIGVLQFNRITRRTSTGPATTEMWGARVEARVEFQAMTV